MFSEFTSGENNTAESIQIRTNRKKHVVVTVELLRKIRKQFDKNQTAKLIAEEEEISLALVYNIISKIASGASDQEILDKKRGRPKKDLTIIKNEISRMLLQDNSFVQSEIASELRKKNITISQSSISRILKDMNYTRKRLVKIPIERNCSTILTKRQEYARTIEYLPNENLVFLDETGCNLHITRNYGYSPLNTKAYKVVRGNRGQNISCMVAIKNTGVISFDIRDGSFDGDSFIQYINEKLSDHFMNNPNDILIMDNCRFHHRKDVIELLERKRIGFMFLPPYSPQLNPIEEYFSFFKASLASMENSFVSRIELKQRIIDVITSSRISFNGWFAHMRKYLEIALSRQEFI